VGGKVHPVIPYLKEIPIWWNRHNHHFETAEQIVNGYLDFFEPDFIVEAEPGLAKGFGFDKDRVLQLSSLLVREGDRDREGHGLSVFSLGGFHGVRSLAHADIIELLNEMSRRPISRSAHDKEFRNRIHNATKGDIWREKNFETLVKKMLLSWD